MESKPYPQQLKKDGVNGGNNEKLHPSCCLVAAMFLSLCVT